MLQRHLAAANRSLLVTKLECVCLRWNCNGITETLKVHTIDSSSALGAVIERTP